VEQKNWTHVRKLLGWERYDSEAAVEAINDLYRQELRLWLNLYLPSLKLVKKVRVGSKVRRVYDAAQTALERVLACAQANPAQVAGQSLDPFQLGKDDRAEAGEDLRDGESAAESEDATGSASEQGGTKTTTNAQPAERPWKSRGDGGSSVTFPMSRRSAPGLHS
jgi:hypothetical protein